MAKNSKNLCGNIVAIYMGYDYGLFNVMNKSALYNFTHNSNKDLINC